MPEQKVTSTVTILYFAFISSTFIYLILGLILHRSGWHPVVVDQTVRSAIVGLSSIVSIGTVFLVSRLRQKGFAESEFSPDQSKDFSKLIVSRTIPLFALSEVPAILGLLQFLLTGNLLALIGLCALSIVAFTMSKPSAETLNRLEMFFRR